LVVLAAAIAACAFWFRGKLDKSAKQLGTIGLIALLVALASAMDWVDCGRSLPVLGLVGCVLLWKRAKGANSGKTVKTLSGEQAAGDTQLKLDVYEKSCNTSAQASAFPFLFSVFALFLLAKLGLYSRIWHYGFALAMPAFCVAIYLLHWMLPTVLQT